MANTTSSIAATLNSLIEICKDGQEGFRTASQDIHNHELKKLFSEYSLQRSAFVGELQELVRELGKEYEKTSSVVGAIHRGWIDLRSALSKGDEHSVLAECERGEDAAKAEYAEALERHTLPAHMASIVQRQYAAVQAAHDRVRDLRDSHVLAH